MEVEVHPFEPFLPEDARLLMLGTFPPSEKRWSVKFYYPNFINDMWRIVGLLFFHDKDYFVDATQKRFRLDLLMLPVSDALRVRLQIKTLKLWRRPISTRCYGAFLIVKAW